jgi:glycosyltransferase involved in cell wall biosynthesis
VKVLPNPIDTAVFVPRPRQRAAGKGTILYTGRIHPEKGVHLLVDAFAILAKEFGELRLRIIGATSIAGGGGGDEYVAKLKAKADGLAVEIIPPIYDRAALAGELQRADYYCYPSLAAQGEAMPVAPVEAMATGLAPIVSALPVFRDYIDPGRTGLVFDHSDEGERAIKNLAGAIRQLVSDPTMADRLGESAAAEALRFSYGSVARMCLDDFAELTRARQQQNA